MVAAVDASSIGFRYGAGAPWLFENLSFSLRPGQTLALLGRNGRGKPFRRAMAPDPDKGVEKQPT